MPPRVAYAETLACCAKLLTECTTQKMSVRKNLAQPNGLAIPMPEFASAQL